MKQLILLMLFSLTINAEVFKIGDCVLNNYEPIWEVTEIRKITQYDSTVDIFKLEAIDRPKYWNYSTGYLNSNVRKVECPK